MAIERDIYELLYASTISTGLDFSEVGRIARNARVSNSENGITGLLVFDGERFAQHLEGRSERVRELFERIRSDPRHTGVRLLHQRPSGVRNYPRFSMAFADIDELESLQSLASKEGEDAFKAFAQLVPKLDLEP